MVRQGMLVRLAATIDRIDPPSRVGRPRLWSALIMLQALWHLARDGCAWRRLPPHQSAWSRFSRWRRRTVLDRALAVLVACRRLAAGRKRRPTGAIIGTQSVRTGPQRGPRGYDAHKKTKGRKRVLMIDTQGDPLGARVVPADTQLISCVGPVAGPCRQYAAAGWRLWPPSPRCCTRDTLWRVTKSRRTAHAC